MTIIDFQVKDVGTFKAKEMLPIIDEANLENEIDQALDYKYYELLERAEKLKNNNKNLYNIIIYRIRTVEICLTLDKVITEKPEWIPSFREITDNNLLIKVWNAYQDKKKELSPAPTK